MKSLNNEALPEYVRLQRQIVAYLHSPAYVNYYKGSDKKLTKNMVKRCILEPFCEKYMKVHAHEDGEQTPPLYRTEIARYID